MTLNDKGTRHQAFQIKDPVIALALLTRLPMPHFSAQTRQTALAAWAFPLVGLVIGLIGASVGGLFHGLGAPAPTTAMLVLLSMIAATGAMHEDGLADCADGFWGGWTVEQRLEIMKDSAIGTYGVVALITTLVLRWDLLTTLIEKEIFLTALLTAAVMSRGAMVWVMFRLRNARKVGLSVQSGRPGLVPTSAAMVLSIAISLVALGGAAFWLIGVVALVTGAVMYISTSKIGGQTGDVLGATQQLSELAVLIALTIML